MLTALTIGSSLEVVGSVFKTRDVISYHNPVVLQLPCEQITLVQEQD